MALSPPTSRHILKTFYEHIYYRFKLYPVLSVLILKLNQFDSEIMFQQAADSTQAVGGGLLQEEGECTVWHMRSLYIDNYRILPLILAVWLCGFQCQSVSPTLWSRLIYLKNYEMYCYLSFIERRNPTEFGNHLIFYVVPPWGWHFLILCKIFKQLFDRLLWNLLHIMNITSGWIVMDLVFPLLFM